MCCVYSLEVSRRRTSNEYLKHVFWEKLEKKMSTILGAMTHMYIYSRLSLSRSPRDSKILRDIRTSTYQTCRIEKKK